MLEWFIHYLTSSFLLCCSPPPMNKMLGSLLPNLPSVSPCSYPLVLLFPVMLSCRCLTLKCRYQPTYFCFSWMITDIVISSLYDSFTSSVRGASSSDKRLVIIYWCNKRAVPSSPLPVWTCIGHLDKHGIRGQNFRRPPPNGRWISLNIYWPLGSWAGNSLCDENGTISSIMQHDPSYCFVFLGSAVPHSLESLLLQQGSLLLKCRTTGTRLKLYWWLKFK